MPKLQCNVNSCSSNSSGYCCRPNIHVDGEAALTSSDTRCQSFTEKRNQMTSSTRYDSPNESLRVTCDARECIHNQSKKCSANSIDIRGDHSDTKCASFKQN
ncbi:DUF1540 domain-containing protein [Aminipila sp.]|uniref:DUF1540 domain-containing protein n=1 Tax=Aminipila sp. TaxID=2060095 RepID=UPI002899AAB1|nr:DUF1540 domain-containing protein [Aminipila sp.]